MYKAIALQLTCQSINQLTTRDDAETQMLTTIDRIDRQIEASVGYVGRDALLVVVPEYFLTGFPQQESLTEWRDKAALELDGRVYEALGAMVQKHKIYFSGNAYELDPHFPDLYFQASFIIGPNGDVILRYRRLNALLTPTPHDVCAYYLEAYGYDAIFPVAKTNIGNLACIASEDIMYPEVARCLTMRGAEVFLHSTSEIGSPVPTQKNVMKVARAVENMGYVVSANSAGLAGINLPLGSMDGGSRIINHRGLVLAEAGLGETMAANADINLAALRQSRQRPGPANLLSRQRFELYADCYSQNSYYPPNTLLAEAPDRAVFARNQQDVIKRLFEK